MPFQYITDLPPQVRETLTPELQQLWLDAFKAVMLLTGNEPEAYQTAWLKAFQASFPGEVEPGSVPQMQPVENVSSVEQPVFAHWVELDTVKLDDATQTTWIQAFPLGTWQHPIHGKIEMTADKATRLADNINNGVRGQDLDVDYDHKARTDEAAGWIKRGEARSDGLWVLVEWTKDAFEKIKNKAYRYFSPEYVDKWTHPKLGKQFQDVMFGGALTNRPFLKDILPINLSEVMGNRHSLEEGGVGVNEKLKALAKKLGLGEDATEEQILDAAVAANLSTESGKDTSDQGGDPGSGESGTPQGSTGDPGTQPLAASEEIKKLAESNPIIAQFLETNKQLAERVVTLESTAHKNAVALKLSELDSDKYMVPPAVKEDLERVMLADPKNAEALFNTVKKLAETGLIEKAERGRQRTTGGNSDTATKRFNEKIAEKMSAGKQYSDAAVETAAEHPELFDEYSQEIKLSEGVN